MKNTVLLLIFLPLFSAAQSYEENFVKTKTYKVNSAVGISDTETDKVQVNLTYFDGLGRPVQNIAHKQSGSGKDLVTHFAYDLLGRIKRELLPYSWGTQDMGYDTDAEANILNFGLYSGHPNPYQESFYERSPLGRPTKIAPPGLEWQGNESSDADRAVKFKFDTNSEADQVQKFIVNAGSLNSGGYYLPGSLYKNTIKNENWTSGKVNTVEEFTDSFGRQLLKRSYESESQKIETYYVYDSEGNLSFVIPPLASETITSIQSSQIPYIYYQSIPLSELLISANGQPIGSSASFAIRIENNLVKIQSSGTVPQCYVDVTKSFELNAMQPLPDMVIGDVFLGPPRYKAYIESNKLKFLQNYETVPVINSFVNNIAAPIPGSDFQYQTVYSAVVSQQVVSNLCYQYKYDSKFRLVEKKIPGKQWEYVVYDKLDRIVATGPVNSPFSNLDNIGWSITKYDLFDRPVINGWLPVGQELNSSSRAALQTQLNGYSSNFAESRTAGDNDINGVAVGYTNSAFPTSGYHVLSYSYFDEYGYTNAPTDFSPIEGQEIYFNNVRKPKGMMTGSWSRFLDGSNAYIGGLSYNLYDSKDRAVRSKTFSHHGGHTTVDHKYNFMGKQEYSITRHAQTNGIDDLVIKDIYAYDNQERLNSHTQQIGQNGLIQLLSMNEYDEVGKLVVKRVGGNDLSGNEPLQKIDYSYNIRGWLTAINNVNSLKDLYGPKDIFAFKINYATVDNSLNGTVVPLYNGNISETFWKTMSDNVLRKYGYSYDALDRLRSSRYQKSGIATHAYDENVSYDKNGNIQHIYRNGALDSQSQPLEIDDLDFTYHPQNKNQLLSVDDQTLNPEGFKDGTPDGSLPQPDDYTYDGNGNLLRDKNKGITAILYNHLNLPTKITFNSNSEISYRYAADGRKIQKKITTFANESVTDYHPGGFQYKDWKLLFFPTTEGYVNYTPTSLSPILGDIGTSENFDYVYNYTDHLGNIRVSYGLDPSTQSLKILEENHYYPFGMKHSNYNTDWNIYIREQGNIKIRPGAPSRAREYNYKYNGKEFQDELGLNMTAMDYRQYDSAIGRFNSIDKLSELTYDISPYRFALNNPIFWADPTGLSEQNGGNLAICPTCPNTPEFQPLIDDPNNTYFYDSETNTATQVIQLDEVVIQGKTKAETAADYYGALESHCNGLNDVLLGVGLTGLRNSYNSNYGKFNSAYYNFYKATGKSSRLPKPGAQRQLLKKLLSNSKFSASSKLLRRAGIAGAVLTVGNIGLDLAEDGAVKASSIIDGGSLAVLGVATVFCPPCAVALGSAILIYGVLDYTFKINDAIDENTEQIQIYNK